MRLSQSNLQLIADQKSAESTDSVSIPNYDRQQTDGAWLHIGVGAFHRAHQSWYLHRLLTESSQSANSNPWRVVVANIRNDGNDTLAALDAQDGLYTLTSVDSDGTQKYEVCGAICRTINAAADPQALTKQLARNDTKIVSITVTEGGYYQRSEDTRLDHNDPDIKAEIAGGPPQSIYAFLYAGLEARAASKGDPLTLLCCDNLRSNGSRLSYALNEYIEARGNTELLAWVKQNVKCPNSMVDRITPRPQPKYAEALQKKFNYQDDAQVMAEPFVQWVIEDEFASDRPPLENVGVEFVDSVLPYEEAKIRILNGGHLCLAYLAALHRYEFFDQAVADPKLRQFLEDFENEDVLPVLPEVPMDAVEYVNTVVNRFANAGIEDTTERLCSDAYVKFPVYLLPTIEANSAAGKPCLHTIGIIASWAAFLQRRAANNIDFEYHDQGLPYIAELMQQEDLLDAIGRDQRLWGDLANDALVQQLKDADAMMRTKGLID